MRYSPQRASLKQEKHSQHIRNAYKMYKYTYFIGYCRYGVKHYIINQSITHISHHQHENLRKGTGYLLLSKNDPRGKKNLLFNSTKDKSKCMDMKRRDP